MALPLTPFFPGVINETEIFFFDNSCPSFNACISAPPEGNGGKEAASIMILI